MHEIDGEFEKEILESIEKVSRWSKERNYKGWDPYDGLNSKLTKKLAKNDMLALLMIQLNLYSPINLRKILGIEKGASNKGLALFARAYAKLHDVTGDPDYRKEAEKILERLEKRTVSEDEKAWASYYFEYVSSNHYLGPDVPDIVGTTEAIKSYSTAYEIFGKEKYLDTALSATESLTSKFLEDDSDEVYFKYVPLKENKVVFNVSALALGAISKVLKYEEDERLISIGNDVLRYLLKNQNDDGSWPYSYNFEKDSYYQQIDYHQGFIIEGMYEFLDFVDEEIVDEVDKSLEEGIKFYREEQFTEEGVCHYRYPTKYPIDTHNQAQGVITFSKLGDMDEENIEFARKITSWTIDNMQDKDGYFYHHKWPLFRNKTPYMRWSNAWMMLAMTVFLDKLER